MRVACKKQASKHANLTQIRVWSRIYNVTFTYILQTKNVVLLEFLRAARLASKANSDRGTLGKVFELLQKT